MIVPFWFKQQYQGKRWDNQGGGDANEDSPTAGHVLVVSVNLSELDYAVLQQWRWAGRGGVEMGGVLGEKLVVGLVCDEVKKKKKNRIYV